MSLSQDLKETYNNITKLSELKIEQLRQGLPNKRKSIEILNNAHKQPKPSHLTDEQWNKWLDVGLKIKENLAISY